MPQAAKVIHTSIICITQFCHLAGWPLEQRLAVVRFLRGQR